MARPRKYSPEVRERAIRMVREHGPEHPSQWAAITSIASKFDFTAETLRKWVRQEERDSGKRAGLTTTEREELSRLRRENRQLKLEREILSKAAAWFARETNSIPPKGSSS
jgi:transposase